MGVLVKNGPPIHHRFQHKFPKLVHKYRYKISYYWAKFGPERLSIGQDIVKSFWVVTFLTHPVDNYCICKVQPVM